MDKIKEKYTNHCNTFSDIYEHLPTLFKYARECNSVFETGVRGVVSSWANLYGLLSNNNGVRKTLFLNDISHIDIEELLEASKNENISIYYIWKNNLEIEFDSYFDMVFIDTWHIYGQLKRELNKFAPKTRKYIIMHDTTVDEFQGETIRCGWDAEKQSRESGFPIEEINKGLWPAIEEFLQNNPEWFLKERFYNNNGLTIIERR